MKANEQTEARGHWTTMLCERCGTEIPGLVESAVVLVLSGKPVICAKCKAQNEKGDT